MPGLRDGGVPSRSRAQVLTPEWRFLEMEPLGGTGAGLWPRGGGGLGPWVPATGRPPGSQGESLLAPWPCTSQPSDPAEMNPLICRTPSTGFRCRRPSAAVAARVHTCGHVQLSAVTGLPKPRCQETSSQLPCCPFADCAVTHDASFFLRTLRLPLFLQLRGVEAPMDHGLHFLLRSDPSKPWQRCIVFRASATIQVKIFKSMKYATFKFSSFFFPNPWVV